MPLIHSYAYNSGGLADFLRSVFAYYVHCRINEIPYFLWVQDHPFEFCFKVQDIPAEFTSNLKLFKDVGSTKTEKTEEILRLIKTENCIIISNIFDFVSFRDLKQYRADFLKFLKLTEPVLTRIEFLRNFYKLEKYNAIHIRLGDKLMKHVNIPSDIRIKDNLSFNKDLEVSLNFLKNNKPIVIFSDNIELKDQLKQKNTINFGPNTVIDIIVLETKVHHTALLSIDIISSIDTIAEFFLLGQAETIITISSSGFSFWSAFLFNRDLYCIVDGVVRPFIETDLKYK